MAKSNGLEQRIQARRERVANQAHPRRLRTNTTNENIKRVRELIEGDLLRSTAVSWIKLDFSIDAKDEIVPSAMC